MSRRQGGVVPRKKACQGCTTAKARCDLGRPSCSRCYGRGLQCEYGNAAAVSPRPPRNVLLQSQSQSPVPTSLGHGTVDMDIATTPSSLTAPPSVFSMTATASEDDTGSFSAAGDHLGPPQPSSSSSPSFARRQTTVGAIGAQDAPISTYIPPSHPLALALDLDDGRALPSPAPAPPPPPPSSTSPFPFSSSSSIHPRASRQVSSQAPGSFRNITLLAPLDPSRIRDRWLDFYLTVPGPATSATTKRAKAYDARTMRLVARTLASYPAMWARDQAHLPPFVHPLQLRGGGKAVGTGRWKGKGRLLPEPLANCLSLLRLCGTAAPGSEALVAESLAREMARLAAVVDAYTPPAATMLLRAGDGDGDSHNATAPRADADADIDHATPLAAFQAYLILAIHIYTVTRRRHQHSSTSSTSSTLRFDPATISTLQNLAAKVSSTGLVCPEEFPPSSSHSPSQISSSPPERRRSTAATENATTTPRRAAWALAEAKRRTVFAAYFLENLTNFDAGGPSYLGEELARVPAPGPRWLWGDSVDVGVGGEDEKVEEEERERLWQREWAEWMRLWGGKGALVLGEFWPALGDGMDLRKEGEGEGEGGSDQERMRREEREDRLSKWAEGVDEFGMFLLAVCTATYGI